MKNLATKRPLNIATVVVSLTMVAACATPAPPPPPPPPPPPVVETVPPRPLPPGGAAYVMQIPQKNALGVRETVAAGISDDEKVWYFRSAWNVAALNCTSSRFDPVLTGYSAYISDYSSALRRVNDRIEAEYRRENGSRRAALKARETVMTSVYNYYALPPARSGFCLAALDVANRMLAEPPTDGIAFAIANYPVLEAPFNRFFDDYEAYQRASAEWDARYGEQYGPSQPGWVAVQEARANGVEVPSVDGPPASTTTQQVQTAIGETQTESGASVPVAPIQGNFVSQPVTQPVATGAEEGG